VNHTKDEYLTVTFPGSTVTGNNTLDGITASIQNFRRQEKRKRTVKSARQLLGLDLKSEEPIEEDDAKKIEEVCDLPRPVYTGKKRGRKPKGYYEQLRKAEESANHTDAGLSFLAKAEGIISKLPDN
jgi:hypothetical protein